MFSCRSILLYVLYATFIIYDKLNSNAVYIACNCKIINGSRKKCAMVAFIPCLTNEKYKLGGNDLFLHILRMTYRKCIADHSSVSCTLVSFRRKTQRDLCGVPIHEHMTRMNRFFSLMIQQTTHKLTCLNQFNKSFWRIRHWMNSSNPSD